MSTLTWGHCGMLCSLWHLPVLPLPCNHPIKYKDAAQTAGYQQDKLAKGRKVDIFLLMILE